VGSAYRGGVWSGPKESHRGLYGQRFHGINEDGYAMVFDMFKGEDGRHEHRSYV
jgi:hypothetical protein